MTACGQEFMVKLAERCKEQKEKTLEKLKEKYLGPLNPNAKKVGALHMQWPHSTQLSILSGTQHEHLEQ